MRRALDVALAIAGLLTLAWFVVLADQADEPAPATAAVTPDSEAPT